MYVIKNSVSARIYIGYTSDLEKRITWHNNLLPTKKSSFTYKNKAGGEWRYVYEKHCNTRKEAVKYEKKLKSSSGRKFIKSLIN